MKAHIESSEKEHIKNPRGNTLNENAISIE
jgi:hypothetical protein